MSDNNVGANASAEAPISNNTESPVDPQVESDEGQEGDAPEVAKEVKKLEKQLKKFKLKVDGEEFEDEIDLNDEEELKKRLQLAKVSQKRMQETATERKRRMEFEKSAEDFLTLLKTNPRAILSDPQIGIDLKKLATEILDEEIEQSKKSPEQRKIEELQKELENRMKKEKDEDERRKTDEMKRLEEEAFNRIDTGITEAIKEFGLPKKPYVLAKFADALMLAHKHDIDLDPKDVAPLIKRQIIEDIQELMGAAPDEVIEDLLGKDVMGRMRKRNLAKARAQVPSVSGIKPTVDSASKSSKSEDKKVNLKDWLKV
jgi:hypothetical protein